MTGASGSRDPGRFYRRTSETRADINATLDQIEHRLTPSQIIDQVLARFSSREGPGRAASGIGRVLVANPVPVMMIGVGLAWLAIAGSMQQAARRPAPVARRTPTPVPQVDREILMAVSRENLAEWLRDARAMENLAIVTLEKQVERLERHPALRMRLQAHLGETRRQAERIDACLARLDGNTSAAEPQERGLPAEHQLAELLRGGTMIKNGIIDYTFEHFEIATYRALISAADEAGEAEVGHTCRENLAEEEAMADWLASHLPEIARQYLYQEAAGRAGAAAMSGRVGHEARDA